MELSAVIDYIAIHWRELISLIGLFLTALGAGRAAYSVITTRKQAGENTVARIASDNPMDWGFTSAAKAQVVASNGALDGFAMISVGTALQMLPILITLVFGAN